MLSKSSSVKVCLTTFLYWVNTFYPISREPKQLKAIVAKLKLIKMAQLKDFPEKLDSISMRQQCCQGDKTSQSLIFRKINT